MNILIFIIWPFGVVASLYTISFIAFIILMTVIEFMYSDMNKKIAGEAGQGRGRTVAIVQGRQKRIRDQYMLKIERLERIKKNLISILTLTKNV